MSAARYEPFSASPKFVFAEMMPNVGTCVVFVLPRPLGLAVRVATGPHGTMLFLNVLVHYINATCLQGFQCMRIESLLFRSGRQCKVCLWVPGIAHGGALKYIGHRFEYPITGWTGKGSLEAAKQCVRTRTEQNH